MTRRKGKFLLRRFWNAKLSAPLPFVPEPRLVMPVYDTRPISAALSAPLQIYREKVNPQVLCWHRESYVHAELSGHPERLYVDAVHPADALFERAIAHQGFGELLAYLAEFDAPTVRIVARTPFFWNVNGNRVLYIAIWSLFPEQPTLSLVRENTPHKQILGPLIESAYQLVAA